MGEYAFVLVAVLLLAAGAYKLLGKPTGQASIEAKRWLEGEGATPNGGGAAGGTHGGGSSNTGLPVTGFRGIRFEDPAKPGSPSPPVASRDDKTVTGSKPGTFADAVDQYFKTLPPASPRRAASERGLPPALPNPAWEAVIHAKTPDEKRHALRVLSDTTNPALDRGMVGDGNCVYAALTTADTLTTGAMAAPTPYANQGAAEVTVGDALADIHANGTFEKAMELDPRKPQLSPTDLKEGQIAYLFAQGYDGEEQGHAMLVTNVGGEMIVVNNQGMNKEAPPGRDLETLDQFANTWRKKVPGNNRYLVVVTNQHIPYVR